MSLLVFGCQDQAPDEQDVVASGRSSQTSTVCGGWSEPAVRPSAYPGWHAEVQGAESATEICATQAEERRLSRVSWRVSPGCKTHGFVLEVKCFGRDHPGDPFTARQA